LFVHDNDRLSFLLALVQIDAIHMMSSFSAELMVPPLHSLEWLQGSPSHDLTHDIQLLLLIQPNCPGCHIHALPAANELASSKQNFDVYCVSTAFEDFEFNTLENAKLLLHHGRLVGVAREQLGNTTEHAPRMPMAYDEVIDKSALSPDLLEVAIQASKQNTREQMAGKVQPGVLEKMLDQAHPDMLLPGKVARVFWSVRAVGTPMWILHRRSGEVIDRKFGQQSPKELLEWIQPLL
jgi:hypothetical protein